LNILIIGAGGMARAIAYDLLNNEPAHTLKIFDRDPAALASLAEFLAPKKIETIAGDASDPSLLDSAMKGMTVAIGASSYNLHYQSSLAAIANHVHWIDLGGNPTVVQNQFGLHEKAVQTGVSLIPDSGLAPGMINIVGGLLASKFDTVDELHFRVGGLPQFPQPPLFYGLVFSPEGLANEYHEPAWVIEDGEVRTVESLTGWERVYFGSPLGTLEAFHTSGGASTMVETFKGRVRTLDYKTLRYPGHLRKIKLLGDLGFWRDDELKIGELVTTPRKALGAILERFGWIKDDLVAVAAWGMGSKDGKLRRVDLKITDYADAATGLSAMARTTGFPAAILARMLAEGTIKERGVLRQEVSVPHELIFEEIGKRGVQVDIKE
jgi:lysine 6-dehydrogenase